MDDRSARQNELAEKKRQLEEIKARRRQPSSVMVDNGDRCAECGKEGALD
jgi:hypothetical protein